MRRETDNGGLALDTKKRSEKAAIATRECKQYGVETHTWRDKVRVRAAEHGLWAARVRRLLRQASRQVERRRLDRADPGRVRAG